MSAKSFLVIILCLQASICGAEMRFVGSSPATITIQATIEAAQDGDTVVVPPGLYRENIRFDGKAITVTGSDPNDWETVCSTVIDGGGNGSCVVFDHGETPASVLEGLTLTRGSGTSMIHPDSGFGNGGGGVFCQDSSPTIRHCNITGNGDTGSRSGPSMAYGGGMALVGDCRAVISHCVIANNTVRDGGGGILIVGDSTENIGSEIRHCTIADNEAYYSWMPDGGYEVDCSGPRPVITHTIIYGNLAESLRIADLSTVTYSCLRSTYAPDPDPMTEAALDFAGLAGNIDRSPQFTGASTNSLGIDVAGYHLRTSSPCIDAGDPAYAGSNETDIDGQARVMGGRVDIGADEVVPHLTVTRPQAGEIFAAGSTHEIRWSGYANAVDIRFSLDNGATWQTVATAVADADGYLWQLPETVESDACLISVVPNASDSTIVLTDSGAFAIRLDATGTEVTSAWPSLGGDYGRSGSSANEALIEGAVAWEQRSEGAVLSSVTIGHDGRIHAACEDGKLYTFDAGGIALRAIDVNTPLLSAPSIGPDGSLFVGAQDGRLRAIAPDGTVRWTYGTGDAIYSSPAVADDGNVYFGSSDGALYAVASDGSPLWQFATKGPGVVPTGAVLASAALGADGTVYAAGLYDPNLYALNPADGSVKWVCNFELYPENPFDPNSAKAGGWPFASPVVGADGTIYQTLLYDSHLYAIEPAGGTIQWATDLLDAPGIDREAEDFNTDADGWSEPVLGPDGTIYVSLDDPYLRAVDPSGAIKWAAKLGDVGAFTLTVDARGWVYAACDDSYVYVVDPDGLQIGRWETAGWPIYPVVAADGTVLVGDSKDYSMLVDNAENLIQALSVESLQDPAPEPEPESEPEPNTGGGGR